MEFITEAALLNNESAFAAAISRSSSLSISDNCPSSDSSIVCLLEDFCCLPLPLLLVLLVTSLYFFTTAIAAKAFLSLSVNFPPTRLLDFNADVAAEFVIPPAADGAESAVCF